MKTGRTYDAGNNTDYTRAAFFTFSGKTTMSFDIRVKDGSAFGYINIVDISVVSLDEEEPAARPGNKLATTVTLIGDKKQDITIYPKILHKGILKLPLNLPIKTSRSLYK